jgi:hypothetical protein
VIDPKDIDDIEDPVQREAVWRFYREQVLNKPDTRPRMFGGIPLRANGRDNGEENSRRFREVFRNGTLDATHIYKEKS